MNMSTYLMHIKKEVWEFKKLLFWVPMIMLVLLVAMPILQFILLESYQWNRILDVLREIEEQTASTPINHIAFASISGLFVPFMIVALLVQLYYFLACLFDERRDLSIYFWRSMPISDALTIGIKLLTGAFVIPGIFMLAATGTLVVMLILAVVACIALMSGYDISLWHLWGSVDIFSNIGLVWLSIVPFVLWMFPLFAWLMLASMYANKAPFLWALLPLVVVLLVEAFIVHYFHLSSAFFAQTFMDYFGINEHVVNQTYVMNSDMKFLPLKLMMSKVSVLGLLVGAGFMYLTYWLRVNRSHH